MSDQFTIQAIFETVDRMTGPMAGITRAVNTMDSALNKVTGMVGALAGAAGLLGIGFGIRSIITDSQEWLGQVQKLKREIGGTAEDVSGLMGAFSLTASGAEALTMHTRFWARSLKGVSTEQDMIADKMLGTSKANPWKQLKAKDMVGSLLEIADKVKGSAEPMRAAAAFYRGSIAQQMLPALMKGSAGLKQLMLDAQAMGLTVNENTLGMFAKFRDTQRAVSGTIKGMKLTIYTELMPVMQEMVDSFKLKLPAALKAIKSGIAWFREHMEAIKNAAKATMQYMLISKGFQMVTGVGAMGMVGNIAGGVGSALGGGSIASIFGLGASLAVMAPVITGIMGVMENFGGIADYVMDSFNRLKDTVMDFGASLVMGFTGITDQTYAMERFKEVMMTVFPAIITEIMDWVGRMTIFVSGALSGGQVVGRAMKGLLPAIAMGDWEGYKEYVTTGEATKSYQAMLDLQDRRATADAFLAGEGLSKYGTNSLIQKHLNEFKNMMVYSDKYMADPQAALNVLRKKYTHPELTVNNMNVDNSQTFSGPINVKMDFRDQDPDRVAVSFKDELLKLADNRQHSPLTPFPAFVRI